MQPMGHHGALVLHGGGCGARICTQDPRALPLQHMTLTALKLDLGFFNTSLTCRGLIVVGLKASVLWIIKLLYLMAKIIDCST